MLKLESQIEAILFFKNEPVTYQELQKTLGQNIDKIREAVAGLQEAFQDRGLTLVTDEESVSLGTHPEASELIEGLRKEELSRDLGRAGLETLAIVLYKGPVSRREIDYIRGVSSGFTLRSLLVRGLIERTDSVAGERSYVYKPTLDLLRHLGISRREELPDFTDAFTKLDKFEQQQDTDGAEQ